MNQIDPGRRPVGNIELRSARCKLKTPVVCRPYPALARFVRWRSWPFVQRAKFFGTGRDFAAWLGLIPRQHSTGGKERLGRITKMGQRDVRRLRITGAMAVISAGKRKGHCDDPWLAKMLAKRPRMVVAVALANRMARRLWAMMATERDDEIRAAT